MFFDFGGGPLNSVADVLIDAITDNEIIQYDSASGKYINRTLAEAGIASAAGFLLNTTDEFVGVLSVVGSIDNTPGSDIDATLLTVGVTGTPTFSWDESEDAFDFNKGLLIEGKVGVGITTLRGDIGGGTTRGFQVEGAGSDTSALSVIRDSASTSGPFLFLGKTRSASTGGSTLVAAGDDLGTIAFLGADGTNLGTIAATIKSEVDGTPGVNDMPGRIVFSTTPDGASAVSEVFRLNALQNMIVGATAGDASALLEVTSTTQGFLPPRMTTTQRDAISSPAGGLAVYNTTTAKLNIFTTAWEAITSA